MGPAALETSVGAKAEIGEKLLWKKTTQLRILPMILYSVIAGEPIQTLRVAKWEGKKANTLRKYLLNSFSFLL